MKRSGGSGQKTEVSGSGSGGRLKPKPLTIVNQYRRRYREPEAWPP
ncbi:MAG: hypothetical protein WC340_04565 [Kiritimatiellia bacterium]